MQNKKKPAHWPKPPADLNEDALDAWYSVCEDLDDIGSQPAKFAKLIHLYAGNFAFLQRVNRLLATQELTTEGAGARSYRNPLVEARNTASAQCRQDLRELGLTPHAQKHKPDEEDDNPFAGMRRSS